jgi:hypothetical protein
VRASECLAVRPAPQGRHRTTCGDRRDAHVGPDTDGATRFKHRLRPGGNREADYAPDVGVLGVAALAPASDLLSLPEGLETLPGVSIFATFMLHATPGPTRTSASRTTSLLVLG